MAAKKSAKVKLPPMFARLVVKDRLTDAASRARVFECLATFDVASVRQELETKIAIERGCLARQQRSLPASVRKAGAFALRVLAVLESAASTAGMWLSIRETKAEGLGAVERALLKTVQGLMDLVFESQSVFDADARVLVAGIGGGGPWDIGQRVVTSGLEAAVVLANDVRLVVLGVLQNPFAQFLPEADPKEMRDGGWRCSPMAGGAQVLTKSESGRVTMIRVVAARVPDRGAIPLKQSGREKPASPQDTDPRDVAILRAMQAGFSGKQVAPETKQYGPPSSESHVAKRRRDLVQWGWITGGRNARLTPSGESWLANIPAAGGRGRSS